MNRLVFNVLCCVLLDGGWTTVFNAPDASECQQVWMIVIFWMQHINHIPIRKLQNYIGCLVFFLRLNPLLTCTYIELTSPFLSTFPFWTILRSTWTTFYRRYFSSIFGLMSGLGEQKGMPLVRPRPYYPRMQTIWAFDLSNLSKPWMMMMIFVTIINSNYRFYS